MSLSKAAFYVADEPWLPPVGTISTFVWDQTSSLPHIHFHIIANEVNKNLEFMAGIQEPLDQAQIKQIREILESRETVLRLVMLNLNYFSMLLSGMALSTR